MSNRVSPSGAGTSPASPQHDITRNRDGSVDLTVQDDTVEGLYALAYAKDGVQGGEGQLAAWLFGAHGGALPEPGTRLHLPAHEHMLAQAKSVSPELTRSALACMRDGVSCGDLRMARHREQRALESPVCEAIAPPTTSTGRTMQKVATHPKQESRTALRGLIDRYGERLQQTAEHTPTPSGYQVVAAELLAEPHLNLGMLTYLQPADIKSLTIPVLQQHVGTERAPEIADAFADALAREAGRQFFTSAHTAIRSHFEEINTRLHDDPHDPKAMRDALLALGDEAAEVLALPTASPASPTERDAIARALNTRIERRLERLAGVPNPDQLFDDYPAVVASMAAGLGLAARRRGDSNSERAVEILEAALAKFLPGVELKRGLTTLLQSKVEVRGGGLLGRGIAMACDFDELLDTTHGLVSKLALGALAGDPNKRVSTELWQWLKDEAGDDLQSGMVELLGWSAEALAE